MTSCDDFLRQYAKKIQDMELTPDRNPGEFLLVGGVRLRHVRLVDSQPFERGSMRKYSAEIEISKACGHTVADIDNVTQMVFSQGLARYAMRCDSGGAQFGDGTGTRLKRFFSCVHDGDLEDGQNRRYKPGRIYLTARNKYRPILVDTYGNPIEADAVHDRCCANVVLMFYHYLITNDPRYPKDVGDTLCVGSILVAVETIP